MKPCMYASSGNKHFFAKSCQRQTYQNYEQSRQKLGTFLENKVISKTSFNKIFFLKILIFKSTWFSKKCLIFVGSVHNFGRSDGDISEKMLISTRCIRGFMSNLVKKSWKDSTLGDMISDKSATMIILGCLQVPPRCPKIFPFKQITYLIEICAQPCCLSLAALA